MKQNIQKLIDQYEYELKRLQEKTYTIEEIGLQMNGVIIQLKTTINDLKKLLQEE